ncbi:MAG: hypothetical protein KJ060_16670 [Candidatus Hydrogenedentes bacterium]|nr:hypothetical protein [Candidatus Hydrogenedentota bacterium]
MAKCRNDGFHFSKEQLLQGVLSQSFIEADVPDRCWEPLCEAVMQRAQKSGLLAGPWPKSRGTRGDEDSIFLFGPDRVGIPRITADTDWD